MGKERYRSGSMLEQEDTRSPGKRLEQLCEIEGISRSELARRLHVAPSQISRILNGETRSVSSNILIRAAREFQVSADYILGLEDEMIKKDDMKKHTAKENEDPKIHIPMLRLLACLMHTFVNLSLNRIHAAQGGLESLKENLKHVLSTDTDRKTTAMGIFVAMAGSTLLHLPMGKTPPLSEYLNELPKGMRLWGCYVLAHKAYLSQEYEKALGIVQTCKMLSTKIYPIAFIYLNLMGAMACMNLRKQDEAKEFFMEAWEIARPDGLIEGIGEHHGLLQGLIETCLKTDYPEDYKKIIQITYQFSYGWRRIHNPVTKEDVADNLTTTEFTIAMLANRGWTNMEIAEYMEMTVRTVKQHLSSVFNKLNIDTRGQLKAYMLR